MSNAPSRREVEAILAINAFRHSLEISERFMSGSHCAADDAYQNFAMDCYDQFLKRGWVTPESLTT